MSVSDALINTLFDGRYRIVRKLGSGGMAAVYLAEDEDLGRRVAIKILDSRYADDDNFLERFRREAKSAAGLSQASDCANLRTKSSLPMPSLPLNSSACGSAALRCSSSRHCG